MPKFQDLTGKTFNRWTVIERAPDQVSKTTGKRNIVWYCVCICGNKNIVQSGALRGNDSMSCGCLAIERSSKSPGEGNFNSIFYHYKYRAKKSNLVFELDRETFKRLTSSNCYYCELPPLNEQKTQMNGQNGYYKHNGIDRKNNTLGYTVSNSVPCCKVCNYAKHKLTMNEFKTWLVRISNNLENILKKE